MAEGAAVTYQGLCIAKRKISRKLVFCDLKRGEEAEAEQPLHAELMFIVGTFGQDLEAMEVAHRDVK